MIKTVKGSKKGLVN